MVEHISTSTTVFRILLNELMKEHKRSALYVSHCWTEAKTPEHYYWNNDLVLEHSWIELLVLMKCGFRAFEPQFHVEQVLLQIVMVIVCRKIHSNPADLFKNEVLILHNNACTIGSIFLQCNSKAFKILKRRRTVIERL